MHNDMQVVAHHRISKYIGCEAGSDEGDSILYPVFAVLERLAGVSVDTAQERPPHAALYGMERACGVSRNELGSRLSYDWHRRAEAIAALSGNGAGGCERFLVFRCHCCNVFVALACCTRSHFFKAEMPKTMSRFAVNKPPLPNDTTTPTASQKPGLTARSDSTLLSIGSTKCSHDGSAFVEKTRVVGHGRSPHHPSIVGLIRIRPEIDAWACATGCSI